MIERGKGGGIQFIGVKTKSRLSDKERGVTLARCEDGVVLLGKLSHNTIIIINQELVDDLQKLINERSV